MQEDYGVYPAPITLSITNYESLLATARSQLDEEAWSGAWAEGEAMTLERAVEYALADEEEPPETFLSTPERLPSSGERTRSPAASWRSPCVSGGV